MKIDDHGMMAAKEGDRVEGGRWGQEQGGGGGCMRLLQKEGFC